MNDYFERVKAFHLKYGFLFNEKPALIPIELAGNRRSWLLEEIKELEEAEKKGDIVGIADALGDIMYLTFGTAVCYGIPIDSVFNEIDRSNMTKSQGDMKGKAVKGFDYVSPNLTFVKLSNPDEYPECFGEQSPECSITCECYDECEKEVMK